MKILTNDNNEYFGLISDYKNGNAFRDAIIADGAEGKIAIIATLIMRPLTDHELSEEGDYSTYEDGHWIPVDVSCETSDVFYLAVETDIPVEAAVETVQVLEERNPFGDYDNIGEPVIDTNVAVNKLNEEQENKEEE